MSSHGIVVDHKESGTRYAVSDRNRNDSIHTYVRDLNPGESVHSFQPRSRVALSSEDKLDIPETYEDMTVQQLKEEIEDRNGLIDQEEDKIVPDGYKKADLITALEADDNPPE